MDKAYICLPEKSNPPSHLHLICITELCLLLLILTVVLHNRIIFMLELDYIPQILSTILPLVNILEIEIELLCGSSITIMSYYA